MSAVEAASIVLATASITFQLLDGYIKGLQPLASIRDAGSEAVVFQGLLELEQYRLQADGELENYVGFSARQIVEALLEDENNVHSDNDVVLRELPSPENRTGLEAIRILILQHAEKG